MAKNKSVGDDARKGAVKKRSQLKTTLDGATTWTKRDKKSGEFMAVKKVAKKTSGKVVAKKFKGVRSREKVMPRYFFDMKDGTRLRDHHGIELPDDASAAILAKTIAEEVAATKPHHNGPQRFVSVIHEAGIEITQVPVHTHSLTR